MALLRLAFLLFALAASAHAVEIRFVPAASEGTVSLGVYDASGKLVRLLCDEWPIASFPPGLNGLSTEWDGKDSAGQPVPAGTYRAKGFVTGNVGVQGEAFHFNDWVASEDAPRVVSVAAAGLLPEGDMLLAARLAGDKGALLRYSPQAANPWQTLATEPRAAALENARISVAADRLFALLDKRIRAIDLATGKEIAVPDLAADTVDISARDERLAVLGGDGIFIFGAADFAKRAGWPLPLVRPIAIALLDGNAAVAAGEDGSLWQGGAEWKRLDVPEGNKVRALASGRGGTFWALEQTGGGSAAVAQYSPEEGRLAEWISSGPGEPVGLAASTDADFFCAIFEQPASERTVAIRRKEGGGWEVVADKTITASDSFGWAEGKLSSSSGDVPAEITVNLRDNPLDPGGPRTLLLRAAAVGDGTGLVTGDGLPLVRVSGESGFGRLLVVAGATPETAQFYQGDGACVQQYNIANLGDMTAFDAGTIEMEGGAEKAPPPEEDPETPTP